MRRIFVPLSFLLATNVFGQTFQDSTQTEKLVSTETYQPVLTLTKEQIERLPAASFMELVTGAFAFVFANPLMAKDFTFVIDGFVTINPNAINLSQIQQIQFYPAGTTATYGSLTKKGTFVISTLEGIKSGMGFSTKTGMLIPNNNENNTLFGTSNGVYIISPRSAFKKKYPAIFSLNEISYSAANAKTKFSSAISNLRSGIPYYSHAFGDVELKTINSLNRLRFSTMTEHQLHKHLRIQAGLFLVNLQDKLENKANDSEISSGPASKTKKNYLGGSAALVYKPVTKFQNTFSLETNWYRQRRETELFTYNGKKQLTTITLANHASYDLISSDDFNLKTELLLRLMNYKEDKGYDSYTYSFNRRILQVTPGLYANWNHILQANLNLQFEDISKPFYYLDEHDFFLSSGLQVNLKNAFLNQCNSLSGLSISSNFIQYRNNEISYDMLDPEPMASDINSNFGEYNHISQSVSTRWLNSLNIGFLRNRIELKFNYLTDECTFPITIIPIAAWDGGGLPVWWGGLALKPRAIYEKLRRAAKGIELKINMLEETKIKWNIQGTLNTEKYTLKKGSTTRSTEPMISTFPYMPGSSYGNIFGGGIIAQNGINEINGITRNTIIDNITNKHKTHWTGGLRTNAEWNRVFVQASALFAFNDGRLSSNSVEHFGNHTLNYLLAGYKFQLHPTKYVKGFEVSMQTRNLIKRKHSTTNSLLYPYYGMGAHVTF